MLSRPDVIPNDIFFINKGIIRVLITDNEGSDKWMMKIKKNLASEKR
jgi:hypothetical protein